MAAIAYKNENLEEAKEYLLKTIQYNDMDIEAYKLLTKICLKQQETEEIISVLETRLEKEDNGDLYYVLAQVYKYMGDTEAYAEFLEDALQNSLTLTFPKKSVEEEYAAVSAVLDEEEEFESEETEEDEADEGACPDPEDARQRTPALCGRSLRGGACQGYTALALDGISELRSAR